MWLWVMSQILVLLWGRCWLTSDSWSTEAVWSEEQSSRNALPCSLPWVMWRQERISPSSSPTHSDVSGDISGTGSSEGPERAGLGHWFGRTPLPKAEIAKFPSLSTCGTKILLEQAATWILQAVIYSLRESKNIILSSWPSLHIPCSNQKAAGTRLALLSLELEQWSRSLGKPHTKLVVQMLGLHLPALCRAWHLQVCLHFDSEECGWNCPQN